MDEEQPYAATVTLHARPPWPNGVRQTVAEPRENFISAGWRVPIEEVARSTSTSSRQNAAQGGVDEGVSAADRLWTCDRSRRFAHRTPPERNRRHAPAGNLGDTARSRSVAAALLHGITALWSGESGMSKCAACLRQNAKLRKLFARDVVHPGAATRFTGGRLTRIRPDGAEAAPRAAASAPPPRLRGVGDSYGVTPATAKCVGRTPRL